jgi:hypothetical protein
LTLNKDLHVYCLSVSVHSCTAFHMYAYGMHIAPICFPNPAMFSQPRYVFPTPLCFPNPAMFSQPRYVFPTPLCFPNPAMFSQPSYVFPTQLCFPNPAMFSQPRYVFPTPRNETAQMHELFKPAVFAHQTHTYYFFKTFYMHFGLIHTISFGLASLLLVSDPLSALPRSLRSMPACPSATWPGGVGDEEKREK